MPELAQFESENFEEFLADPILTVACVLLVAVSVTWIVVARLVARNLRRAVERGLKSSNVDVARPARDIWSAPP